MHIVFAKYSSLWLNIQSIQKILGMFV